MVSRVHHMCIVDRSNNIFLHVEDIGIKKKSPLCPSLAWSHIVSSLIENQAEAEIQPPPPDPDAESQGYIRYKREIKGESNLSTTSWLLNWPEQIHLQTLTL